MKSASINEAEREREREEGGGGEKMNDIEERDDYYKDWGREREKVKGDK